MKTLTLFHHTFTEMSHQQFGVFKSEYNRSDDISLADVYNRYSYEKEKAYQYCRELYYIVDGYDFRIISHNTFSFAVGFRFMLDENEYFVTITKSHDYIKKM